MNIGMNYSGKNTGNFTVWAPFIREMSLKILNDKEPQEISMHKDDKGYFNVSDVFIPEGTKYFFRLNNRVDRPDPSSQYQPDGPHGPSETVDHNAFSWTDGFWQNLRLEEMIIYEMHVGCFTEKGDFESAIGRLPDLKQLGVNTIEIMPVSQFPGDRNWGYDGTYLFSVQNSYGGPKGLKEFVNACHSQNMAVLLDVVYNHFGPEGNYLAEYGPYFTEKYHTPWGAALNFDGAYSDEVRNFFLQNMLHWFENYHIDGLRLDAIHGIYDFSAKHILQELAEIAESFSRKKGKKFFLIAESDLNDTRIIRPISKGGYGVDAAWNDDFHHSLHVLLTNEQKGYYRDFCSLAQFNKAVEKGYVFQGEYSPYRTRSHGNYSGDIQPFQFVVFSQNHDQVGNRMLGERLSSLVNFEALKVAAASVIFSPYIPLLFMGEEYGETNPFLYFISHTDPNLVHAVREGRKKEFSAFIWNEEPPDPQGVSTFNQSKLDWGKKNQGHHQVLFRFYQNAIHLRRTVPALTSYDRSKSKAISYPEKKISIIHRWNNDSEVCIVISFCDKKQSLKFELEGEWDILLDSSQKVWLGEREVISGNTALNKESVDLEPFSVLLVLKKDKEKKDD